MLKKFYAVTKTSLYLAIIDGKKRSPELTKVALRGKSGIKIGKIHEKGPLLSIGNHLIVPFIPVGGMVTSFEREIALVNPDCFGVVTGEVIALFLKRKDAFPCYRAKGKNPCDNRWREQTIEVLRAIGENHPQCSISTRPTFWLLDPKEWQ